MYRAPAATAVKTMPGAAAAVRASQLTPVICHITMRAKRVPKGPLMVTVSRLVPKSAMTAPVTMRKDIWMMTLKMVCTPSIMPKVLAKMPAII